MVHRAPKRHDDKLQIIVILACLENIGGIGAVEFDSGHLAVQFTAIARELAGDIDSLGAGLGGEDRGLGGKGEGGGKRGKEGVKTAVEIQAGETLARKAVIGLEGAQNGPAVASFEHVPDAVIGAPEQA